MKYQSKIAQKIKSKYKYKKINIIIKISETENIAA